MIWALIGDIGLDMTKARADADGPAIDQLLRQDIADMQALKVDRTPGFFVNGRFLSGAQPPESFKALIDGYERRIEDLTAEVTSLRDEVKKLRQALDERPRP